MVGNSSEETEGSVILQTQNKVSY